MDDLAFLLAKWLPALGIVLGLVFAALLVSLRMDEAHEDARRRHAHPRARLPWRLR
jgi:hypothetical protein